MVSEHNQPSNINITSLKDYLIELSDFFDNNPISNPLDHYFYRGQKGHTKEVLPCLLRDNLISSESRIIKDAYGRRPAIFKEQNTPFERLTKLQHYGLKTRLLDLTLNPLVALFFACQIKDDEDRRDGVVYIYCSESSDYDSKEIKIHAAISEMEIKKDGISIRNLCMNLKDLGVLTSLDYNQYVEGNHMDFVNILKNDYFVISNLSNDRLIQQSGAFYLPGCITVENSENRETCSIHKVCGGGVEKYQLYEFNIPANYKKAILEELDMYNINSASLFPELDYQMRYINDTHSHKKDHSTDQNKVNSSTRYNEREMDETYEDASSEATVKSGPEQNNLVETKIKKIFTDKQFIPTVSSFNSIADDAYFKDIFNEVLDKSDLERSLYEIILSIFKKYPNTDWYKKPIIRSNIHKDIKRTLYNKNYPPDNAKKLADEIVNDVVEKMKNDDEPTSNDV